MAPLHEAALDADSFPRRLAAGAFPVNAALAVCGVLIGLFCVLAPLNVALMVLPGMALVAAVALKPEAGYYVSLAMLPFDLTQIYLYTSVHHYLFLIFPYMFPLTLTACVWGLYSLSGLRQAAPRNAITAVMLMLITCEGLSLIWAPRTNLGILLLVSLSINYLYFSLSQKVITSPKAVGYALNALIIAAFITSAGVFGAQWYEYKAKYFLGDMGGIALHFGKHGTRLAGFGSENNSGGLCVTGVFMVIARMYMNGKPRPSFRELGLIVLFVSGMILTASRGSLVGLVAGISLLLLLNEDLRGRLFRLSAIFAAILGIIVLLTKPGMIDRMIVGIGLPSTTIFSEQKVSTGVSVADEGVSGLDQRKYWWGKALARMTEQPFKLLSGLGIGGFILYSGTIYTHSLLLSFFFDIGLMGALILTAALAILLTSVARTLRNKAIPRNIRLMVMAVVCGFFAEITVHGLIDYDFFSYTARLFWFRLGLLAAVINVANQMAAVNGAKEAK
ncbi:MAG: hypothetical protein HZB29_07680 [Nitrospinae bacterium]|nr:hypothetical protein [Nitrospinota bacterium]